VLESKLQAKGIEFEKNESEQAIADLGYSTAPLLKVDDKVMTFAEAIQYLNTIS
jgi:hypothetical protein